MSRTCPGKGHEWGICNSPCPESQMGNPAGPAAPSQAQYNPWGAWGACSVTCGVGSTLPKADWEVREGSLIEGLRYRERSCPLGLAGAPGVCSGHSLEQVECRAAGPCSTPPTPPPRVVFVTVPPRVLVRNLPYHTHFLAAFQANPMVMGNPGPR